MASVFTPEDVWFGGDYELYIEVKLASSVPLLLRTLWSHSAIEGCYLNNRIEPSHQPRVQPDEIGSRDRAYGIAQLPNGSRVACWSYVFRPIEEDENGEDPSPLCAVALCIPMSTLSQAYPVGGYPFGPMEGVLQWKKELDEWLVGIGRFIFERMPFALALIGFEVNTLETISAHSVAAHGIPGRRHDGILWPGGNGLEWYPPTSP